MKITMRRSGNDGESFRKVLVGCKFDSDEFRLFQTVLFKLWMAIEDCPMQKADWEQINRLFEEDQAQNSN